MDETDPKSPLLEASSAKGRAQPPSHFRPLRWGLLRVPLLPVESLTLLRGSDTVQEQRTGVEIGTDEPTPLDEDPDIRLALFSGSPSLYQALEREAAESRISPAGSRRVSSQADPLRNKLTRYLTRMATRPTPFGFLAGVSLVTFGERTTVAIERALDRRASRPSMEVVDRFVQSLEERASVRRQLKWVRNPTAWERAGRLVVNAAPGERGNAGHNRSIELTSLTRRFLEAARQPVDGTVLLAEVARAEELSPAAVEQCFTELCRQGVLLADLAPAMTGELPSGALARRLAAIEGIDQERDGWDELLRTLAGADAMATPEALPQYRLAREQACQLAGSCAGDPIHFDARTALTADEVSTAVATEAARAAELLFRLAPCPAGSSATAAYRQLFLSRYGEGREVPVLELLDPNIGLGPYSLQVLKAPSAETGNRRNSLLVNLACRALRSGEREIELEEATIQQLDTGPLATANVPASLDLNVLIGADSREAIDEGQFDLIVGPNVGAPAAGRHLGRFAHLLGGSAEQALREIATAEQLARPGWLDVELVYPPPTGQLGNLVIRPRVRPREVRIGIAPPPGDTGQLAIGEILVGVEGNRFHLRCPRRDRRLRITSGHMLNPWLAPEVCRFLLMASSDGEPSLGPFHWGAAESFPYLPRVRAGKTILRPAEWKLDTSVFPLFRTADPHGFREALARWRELWRVPRYVFLAQSDQRLLWDLSSDESIEAVWRELGRLREGERIVLQEALPTPDRLWVTGREGHYYSELVISLVALADREAGKNEPSSPPVGVPTVATTPGTRANREAAPCLDGATRGEAPRFPPGSEWCYLKFYCGPDFLDDMIADQLPRLLDPFTETGVIDKWFFLRYLDPDPHLRLRLHGSADSLWRQVLPHASGLASEWIDTGWCRRFSIETYEPEIDRYGGLTGMKLAEDIFHADSVAVLEYLQVWRRGGGAPPLQDLAVVTVDRLLAGLIPHEATRLQWIRQQGAKSTPIGAEFRERKELFRKWLTGTGRDSGPPGEAWSEIGSRWCATIRPTGRLLATCFEEGALSRTPDELFRSFVHLHCNRLVGTNRYAELRVRELLRRTRDSLAAAPVGSDRETRAPLGPVTGD